MKKVMFVSSDNAKKPSFGYKIKSAFERQGWKTSVFNFRFMQIQRNKITNKLLNNALEKYAISQNPDLVFVYKGNTINNKVIENISNAGIKTTNWTMDDPFGHMNDFNNIKNRNEYDHFFVFDPYYIKELKETGQENSHYLPCAVDPSLYKEIIPFKKRKYLTDLSFLGTYQKNRGDTLEKLHDYNMKIWGFHWNKLRKDSPIRENLQKEIFNGNKNMEGVTNICKVFNRSKINLNVHYPHSKESVNLRTFEVSATKSFQLCDYFKDLPNLYKPKKEIAIYKNIRELREQIDYYLDNEEERNKISIRAYKRTLKDHTFDNRIKQVIKTIS